MRMLTAAVLAAATLLGAVGLSGQWHSAQAQVVAQAGTQYVVGVSGMT
ncbi:MAG: hypothetical protein AB7V27_16725 [Candidatus Binatia bacterium]